jgi:hypothetical protein
MEAPTLSPKEAEFIKAFDNVLDIMSCLHPAPQTEKEVFIYRKINDLRRNLEKLGTLL